MNRLGNLSLRLCMCGVFYLSLGFGIVHAEPGSSFDLNTGVLTAPCVDILSAGLPAGENNARLSYALDMSLNGSLLSVGNLVEITASGSCSATFEATTGRYTDLLRVGSDLVEIDLNYAGGVDFAPLAVFFQRNFSADDLSTFVGNTSVLQIAGEIDASATLKRADGSAAPSFITFTGGELNASPTAGDEGSYNLRLEWADQVEFITVNVTADPASIVNLSAQPDALPAHSALHLYAAESFFNTPLPDDVAVDADSDMLMQGLIQSGQFVVQVGQFSATVFFADNSTPVFDVSLPCGEFWELGINQINSVPIPPWAVPSNDVDGDENPPVGCDEESGQDNFMVILDLENRCEYDLWQTRQESSNWVASFGTAFTMDGPGVHPNGMSSRGSGLAFLGGVIWPSEIASGVINHPLAFSYEFPKAGGPVAPATDSDGISTEAFALPEGARIQLDPALDLDSLSLTDYERTIAKAMQDYGLILVDRGGVGPIGLYAIDSASATANPYSNSWGEDDFADLSNLDVTQLPLRVLELPAQNTGYQEAKQLASNRCTTYQ
ncbi:MAG: hypothetical protein O2971_12880 [Proteobacteria bacterium]|nr:hypothetical protein [Pseudomonadota bacterium]